MPDNRTRIVVVSDVTPAPQTTNGFSGRLFGFLTALAGVGAVTLLTVGGNEEPAGVVDQVASPDWGTSLAPGPSRPSTKAGRLWVQLTGPWPDMCRVDADALAAAIDDHHADLVLVHLPYLVHAIPRLRGAAPVIAVLEEGWERLRPPPANPLRAALRRLEDHRIAALYGKVGARAAAVTVISELEADWFARYGLTCVLLPHAIDTSYFTPQPPAPEHDEMLDVAVFGDLTRDRNWRPTLEFVEASRPDRSWRWGFVGRSGSEITDRAAPGDLVTGLVEDVRPFYQRSRVVVVPADTGTGVKTTLLQAWAMQRPAVVSRQATVGLAVQDGGNALVADTPAHAVELVARLLDDTSLASRIAAEGRRTVVEQHGIVAVGERLATLARDVLRGM